MENEALLDHVADIVSAHVSNNAVAAADLPGLIQAVYASLAALGQAPEPAVAELKPAVSVRASVKPDAVTCLECGEKMTMLKRHLSTEHDLTPAEYRTRWSLPADYPMVAPDYAAKRKELAVRIGLGRKPGQSPKAEANPAPEAAPKAQPKAAAAPAKRKKLGVAFGSVDAI
ncbi:MAG: MucR family transcriptional regulator [Proteobacteria bacterium]|nr:MucR family transcriptional regulator [Pseudomonadota bacterium]